ncbi:hypothetical protein [Cytobacillus horneckiae]|uniref:Uncharacterized protein n=1 Tax=Cytobacillus horneckiae TaxID=549687 RepID=A0A2N0ZH51_9BACI|nr:hypothetical protein [Cytobacillus horneckiae]MEC1158621.1 hypothetical protein [Cytobacillus horneckiae]MED2939191.1 hypothetical protein [Cytobacillus horneckiae]PKG28823.1 hypothetical protein CWS20_11675 [Cytobacillus horneckiae]
MNQETTVLDSMLQNIDQLNEEEAKAFLKLIYTRINIYEKGNGNYLAEKLIKDISNVFTRIPEVTQIRVGKK